MFNKPYLGEGNGRGRNSSKTAMVWHIYILTLLHILADDPPNQSPLRKPEERGDIPTLITLLRVAFAS